MITEDSELPVLLFLAGPNGAGKSTFFQLYLSDLGWPFVNADEIGKALREEAIPGSAEDFDRLAFVRAEELREARLAAGASFCTETVFSDPEGSKLEFLGLAQGLGYHVILVFIGLDSPELSVARVMQRVELGGHDVPDAKLLARYPRTIANLKAAIPLVDDAYLFDNSSASDPFRMVAIYSEGQLVLQNEPLPGWTLGLPGL